ncbi:hypothetical protein BJ165DRAFT_1119608 [Panaeolus papilionaceus]|nr:hypothetical protein BJ165DRAFT_1119608 [Panaeolus papilionaceus]
MSAGTLRVLLDSNMRGVRAIVRVYVNYTNDWARDLSRVCRVARADDDGESVVGIFSPQFPSALPLEAQLSFGIIVWLPRSSSQRVIKGLKADLYNSESDVDVEAVSAERVSIITTNARSDVFIDAELTSSSSIAPKVVLSTSGRSLYANFTLVSATMAGGAFNINVTANHGDSKVLFPAQPLDSKLSFVSSMINNSQATIKFHPAYEGSFDIRGGSVNIWNDPTIDDPSGRHRWRTFQSQRSDDHLSGSTAWQQDHEGYGQVRIVSTNARLDVAF